MSRNIAILVDGGFFLKRLSKLVASARFQKPQGAAALVKVMARAHVRMLTGSNDRWMDHVYRIFFYDAAPFDGRAVHPLSQQRIDFHKTPVALYRTELFECLRRQRKVALRLGKVLKEGGWAPPTDKVQRLLPTRAFFQGLELDAAADGDPLTLNPEQVAEAKRLNKHWAAIADHDVRLGFRQKGVDMRIGLDIASITLKKQASTIVLVAGDSDFVPAAKLARREGVEFILDPMWQTVNADLFEHIDGLQSGLPKPRTRPGTAPEGAPETATEEHA